jgi:adenosylcobyric acid synthase
LASEYDVIVIEGAGSPAELNLAKDDFVNMGMARMAGAPVLLVGDIDRGGIFPQLYGTIKLLPPDDASRVKATIVNKFRGDITLFDDGVKILEDICGVPCAGVVPYLDVDIEDEDSLSTRLTRRDRNAALDIAVIGMPHISNFTDFTALEATPGAGVRYVGSAEDLSNPDFIILPGTKNTIADLLRLRECGLEAGVKKIAARGVPILGICGGYQMLGERITDSEGAEGGGSVNGMGLLPVNTEFLPEKRRTRVTAQALNVGGILAPMTGAALDGYEIHMGITSRADDAAPLIQLSDGSYDGCQSGNIYGTYLHGFFDSAECRDAVLGAIAKVKGVTLEEKAFDYKAYKDRQFDILARGVRERLNMKLIMDILERGG